MQEDNRELQKAIEWAQATMEEVLKKLYPVMRSLCIDRIRVRQGSRLLVKSKGKLQIV